MFSFFTSKKKKKRLAAAERLAELQRLSIIFETFNKFQHGGLLYCDFRSPVKTVTIAQIVADQFLYDDYPNGWHHFLHQLHLWAVHQWSVNNYTRLYHKAMADAEAAAYKRDHTITPEGRKHARMRAAAQFDDDQVRSEAPVPDMQFVVLGLADEPIIVAKMINGEYHTESVPDELLKREEEEKDE